MNKPHGTLSPFGTCRLCLVLFVVTSLIVIMLVAIIAPRVWWMNREAADFQRLNTEVTRLGGTADMLDMNFSEKEIALFVDFRHTTLGDDTFARLARMPAFKHLHHLLLADTRITDKSLELLEKSPHLITLDVSRTTISDKGLESIERLSWLSTLRLSGTDITDLGLASLLERSNAMNLRSIDLRQTKVSAAGVQKLFDAFPPIQINHPSVVNPLGIRDK